MSLLLQVVVPAKAQASLSVAVRVRPILKAEQTGNNKRDIIRVIDGKIVVVLDPDEIKDYLDQVQNRTKEKKYTFDVAFDTQVRKQRTIHMMQLTGCGSSNTRTAAWCCQLVPG